jgi:hypothetical protein
MKNRPKAPPMGFFSQAYRNRGFRPSLSKPDAFYLIDGSPSGQLFPRTRIAKCGMPFTPPSPGGVFRMRCGYSSGVLPFLRVAPSKADRRWDLMRSHGRLRPFLDELDAWMGSAGVLPAGA